MRKILQKIALILPLVMSVVAKAEMVDTFEFHSDTDRIRAVALAKSLRCPQCQNQNLVESNATTAYKLRLEVYQMVNEGKSDQEIIEIMTQRFGHFVNYNPPFTPHTWALWGIPVGLVVILFSAIFWRTKRRKAEAKS